jgi:hypothetical protein
MPIRHIFYHVDRFTIGTRQSSITHRLFCLGEIYLPFFVDRLMIARGVENMLHYSSTPLFEKNPHVHIKIIKMLHYSFPILFDKISISSFSDWLAIGTRVLFFDGVFLQYFDGGKVLNRFANSTFCSTSKTIDMSFIASFTRKNTTTYF